MEDVTRLKQSKTGLNLIRNFVAQHRQCNSVNVFDFLEKEEEKSD